MEKFEPNLIEQNPEEDTSVSPDSQEDIQIQVEKKQRPKKSSGLSRILQAGVLAGAALFGANGYAEASNEKAEEPKEQPKQTQRMPGMSKSMARMIEQSRGDMEKAKEIAKEKGVTGNTITFKKVGGVITEVNVDGKKIDVELTPDQKKIVEISEKLSK